MLLAPAATGEALLDPALSLEDSNAPVLGAGYAEVGFAQLTENLLEYRRSHT
jgi:hypothetical protein